MTDSVDAHNLSLVSPQQRFASVYREHLGWMLQTVRRMGVAGPEQEDVAHDVFSTAWRKIDSFSPERPMRPWLFGIAFRIIGNRKANKSAAAVTLDDSLELREGRVDRPDELLEGERARAHVLQALESLPLEQRALFVGHDIEQTPIHALARELEVPLNTAYSRLRLARQKFEATFSSLQGQVPHG